MRKSPVARLEQPRVHPKRVRARRCALRHPDGEDERQPGPLLPALAEIVHVRIVRRAGLPAAIAAQAIGEQQRRVADHEPRVVWLVEQARDVRELGVAERVFGLRVPHVLEEQLE